MTESPDNLDTPCANCGHRNGRHYISRLEAGQACADCESRGGFCHGFEPGAVPA